MSEIVKEEYVHFYLLTTIVDKVTEFKGGSIGLDRVVMKSITNMPIRYLSETAIRILADIDKMEIERAIEENKNT